MANISPSKRDEYTNIILNYTDFCGTQKDWKDQYGTDVGLLSMMCFYGLFEVENKVYTPVEGLRVTKKTAGQILKTLINRREESQRRQKLKNGTPEPPSELDAVRVLTDLGYCIIAPEVNMEEYAKTWLHEKGYRGELEMLVKKTITI